MNRLFVYGTLRSNRINTVIPEVASYIKHKAKGYVKAKLFDLGEYPGAVISEKPEKVYGEIVEIDPEKLEHVLNVLDEYEEVHQNPTKSLFKRQKVMVNTQDGKRFYAWVYWYNKNINGAKVIKSGVYRQKNATTK